VLKHLYCWEGEYENAFCVFFFTFFTFKHLLDGLFLLLRALVTCYIFLSAMSFYNYTIGYILSNNSAQNQYSPLK